MPQANKTWRLKKTLNRDLEFRAFQEEDVKFVWAAYKIDGLSEFDEKFADKSLSASEFQAAFMEELLSVYHEGWTLIAPTVKGVRPVGMVLGFWAHPDPRFKTYLNIGCILWFPWASARNRVESAVNFFNAMRTEVKMVDYVRHKDKKFFEMLARHGVMRRVGTSYNVYPNQPALIFETRSA